MELPFGTLRPLSFLDIAVQATERLTATPNYLRGEG